MNSNFIIKSKSSPPHFGALVSALLFCALATALPGGIAAKNLQQVPVIDVTDLYHPHQDVGDNFDLVTAYALPELDLRAVVLDCTEPFRQPLAKTPGRGCFQTRTGRASPASFPFCNSTVYLAGMCLAERFLSPACNRPRTRMLDGPPFEQIGIELVLKTLRESRAPVHIVSFGSARAVAVVFQPSRNWERFCFKEAFPGCPFYKMSAHKKIAHDALVQVLLRSGRSVARAGIKVEE